MTSFLQNVLFQASEPWQVMQHSPGRLNMAVARDSQNEVDLQSQFFAPGLKNTHCFNLAGPPVAGAAVNSSFGGDNSETSQSACLSCHRYLKGQLNASKAWI